MDNYSNAMGYGFWCGQACAQKKIAAGIPPLGAGRAAKIQGAQSDAILAQAALEAQRKEDTSWSPLAVTGVVVASLLGIALMVVVIKKAKSK